MARNILLSGPPGVGKTTIIRKVIETFRSDAGGFFTGEIREGGKRVGFEIATLSGGKGILAHVKIKSRTKVGKYGVDLKSLERVGVEALRTAMEKKKLVVVDEIGKMELFSDKFRDTVWNALDSEAVVLGTITLARSPFTDRVKSRPDVELLSVSRSNRDHLVEVIRAKI